MIGFIWCFSQALAGTRAKVASMHRAAMVTPRRLPLGFVPIGIGC
jgi:hypothetical protein